jgi:hypothetical protein
LLRQIARSESAERPMGRGEAAYQRAFATKPRPEPGPVVSLRRTLY